MDRVPRRQITALWFAFIAFFGMVNNASAQAWVPPSGSGSVSLSYQRIDNTGHLRTNGMLAERGQSLDMGLFLEADYSVTDRLSVAAGLPYVFAKYQGAPFIPPIPYLPNDQCHCWHGGWQDWGVSGRYNVIRTANGAFSLTPSVSVGVPSHNYDFRGESVLGRDLKEARIGIDAGQRLDAISPNLLVEGHYSYAFVERVIEIGTNRSNAGVATTYLLFHRRLAARGFATWQRTHGGLRLGSAAPASLVLPGEVDTPERVFQHDRLLRDNYFHAGGGFSYAFPLMDVFASYNAFVSGTDSHAGRAITVGVSWPFQLRGAHGN